jgi:hypothetical protein
MKTFRNGGQASRSFLRSRIGRIGALALLVGGMGCTDLWGTLQGSGAGGAGASSASGMGGAGGMGGGAVGIDGGIFQPAATDLVSAGQLSQNTSFVMVSTVGQSTQSQELSTTQGFILRGGLVGAIGSQP